MRPTATLVASGAGRLGGRNLGLAIGAVAGLAGLAVLGATVIFPQKAAVAAIAPGPAAPAGPSAADLALARHSELAHVFALVKANFPADYPELRRRADGLLAAGDMAGATWAMLTLANHIVERDAPDALEHADSARLGEFMRRSVDFIGAVQRTSPALCARAGLGSFQDAELKPMLAEEPMLNAASRMAAATLTAIDAGRRQQIRYPRPARDEEAMLAQAVRQQGLSLADGLAYRTGGLASLPAEKRCDLMLKSFRALLGTPEPARSRFIAQAAAAATRKSKTPPKR